jgi:oxygen-independent coproporphyrinogen-3 oxidase
MTGLRLTQEGINQEEFEARFGQSMRAVYEKEIDELLEVGLLEQFAGVEDCKSLRLSKRGRLLGNQVFMRFV